MDILNLTLKSLNSLVKYLQDPFVLGLLGMMALASVFPDGAHPAYGLTQVSQVGVWLIFIFYGLKIPKATLRTNVTHWRLHVAIQCTTFCLFPAFFWFLKPLLFVGQFQAWWGGFWFLAALPSTVSSSVVMVGLAKGNVPGALFNATISGVIGVLITPLWILGDFETTGIWNMYLDLFLSVVLPALLGLALQPWGGKWVQRQAKRLAWMDKGTIWLIVYLSFAETFQSPSWQTIPVSELSFVALATLAIFLFFFISIQGLNRWFRWFSFEDEIAWLFCGSKKSLVHGSVFLPILFPGQVGGLILLPLMMYHAWQLILVGYVASRWGQDNPS